jgi:hypothetical protein
MSLLAPPPFHALVYEVLLEMFYYIKASYARRVRM